MDTASDKYLDLRALSEYSSLAVPTLRDYLKGNGGIPYFKARGKVLVRRSEFDAWLEQFRATRNQELDSLVKGVMDSLKNGESER